MTTDELLALHQKTCDDARAIMRAKNHDYTSGSADPFANFRASSVFGIHPVKGILVRMTDKLKRIQSFIERGELKVDDEPVDDVFRDLINYSVLMKGIIAEQSQAEDKDPQWLNPCVV